MHVLRLCSVYESRQRAIGGRNDTVGGMQMHTAAITCRLDAAGVRQTVITAHRPGAPRRERIGTLGRLRRVGVPVEHPRQWWAVPATIEAIIATRSVDVVHAHVGEDIAVLPIAYSAAARHQAPLVITVHSSPGHTVRPVDLRTATIHGVGASPSAASCRGRRQ